MPLHPKIDFTTYMLYYVSTLVKGDVRLLDVKLLEQAEKDLREIAKRDKSLVTEILTKIDNLKNEEYDKLEIETITGIKLNNRIQEIKIKSPQSVRILYSTFTKNGRVHIVVAIERKKKGRFSSDFFKMLDKRIGQELAMQGRE